ncbi:Negative regulator of mitotic exit [Vermiconidia calcicola]|uniref:Negative regulator of mitotic exit n=1 Tax=Vermiconidia calcicola TaxID=1690605 RepID=A0ACC3MPD8_9PEZI|nr:Negative regulator of mitotic exit [Vermiconidia calcicola]
MSFLFKSKQKGPPNALPSASRDIRSADGTPNSSSQIPTLNGSINGAVKPGSPTPGTSVNNSLNSLAGNDQFGRPSGTSSVRQSEEKSAAVSEDNIRSGPPSPEQKSMRNASQEPRQRLQNQGRPVGPDPSPYPWSSRSLTFTVTHQHPFPRYGAAVNSTASRDGSIYLMGGLINGSTVKGDLWMVEAGPGSMPCYPVATTSEGPGPRVGHASLLVGNAFIVFGGDTKMDEGDQLDDTLYLLNTSTKQWSRALPAGPRPPGRYGHTLNILGSKIYVFGGQVEGYFFNDLVAFDLNALQQATNRWEILVQNTIDGGPPHGQIPPARTNHTIVTWQDKLYLFGGTDGVHWYNDVWSYSPHTNSWTQLDCIGYIPSPREGHAAALVGDVMYIFGGRTEEGNDLGDLAAFRISSRRWYTFQNMGPSPSPRSGHSMTTVGKQIVVLAGEPSSAPRDPVELAFAYFLDTGKIRYPPDSAAQGPGSVQQRKPSGDKNAIPMGPQRGQLQSREQLESPRSGNASDMRGRSESLRSGGDGSRLPQATPRPPLQGQLPAPSGPPPQPPPQQQQRPNGAPPSRQPSRPDRAMSPSSPTGATQIMDRSLMSSPQPRGPPTMQDENTPTSPSFAPERSYYDTESPDAPRTYKPETYRPVQEQGVQALNRTTSRSPNGSIDESGLSRAASRTQGGSVDETALNPSASRTQGGSIDEGALSRSTSRNHGGSIDEGTLNRSTSRNQNSTIFEEDGPELPMATPFETPDQMQRAREFRQEDQPQDSGIGSSPALTHQYDELAKELEQLKHRNAWYASELAIARKAGYQTRLTDSPVMDERAVEVFGDDDKPLIEALLKMRTELARVQETIDEQSKSAAEKIAEIEKQRDAAVGEAVYAKTRLAGHGSPNMDSEGKRSPDQDRNNDMGRRLASSLTAQRELSSRIDGLIQEVEAEKKARSFAEDTAEAAQKRVSELDVYRQQYSSGMESLRSELHEAQREARDASANHAEIKSQHDMLSIDKRELDGKLEGALAETQNHSSILVSLRDAVTASQDKAQMLEERLEEEHAYREELEQKLRRLKSEHEEQTSELETTSRRLQDAEEMAEKHAEEARTHRGAVLAGLGKVNERGIGASDVADERVATLQSQVENANAMVRQNQAAADSAADKLRRAEERIAGLEAFQEQASREGLSVRKQLQSLTRENQGLSTQKTELEQKFQSQMLETNALAVQHASLRDILGERGINAADVRRSRAMDSPSSLSRFSTPDLQRVRELEQQLENSLKSHDDMKAQFEEVSERDEKMKREYEDKLTALDNDHQAAVKYLRGTEKMLSKMKQELQRVKDENRELKKKIDKAKDDGESSKRGTPDDWEAERERLKREVADVQANLQYSVSDLETKISAMQQQLQAAEGELQQTRVAHATSQAELQTLTATHTASRSNIEKLQKDNTMLEERAHDAENKVQLLLDQVESSVDNYRRQSRGGEGMPNMNGVFHQRPMSEMSEMSPDTNHIGEHTRSQSDGDNSTTSDAPAGDARDSLALDSLASELDALRSHWETTKNYRLSDKFDFEKSPAHAHHTATSFGSMADWRQRLDISDDDDKSRPTTSDGADTVRGEDEAGMAVTTPTQKNMI